MGSSVPGHGIPVIGAAAVGIDSKGLGGMARCMMFSQVVCEWDYLLGRDFL